MAHGVPSRRKSDNNLQDDYDDGMAPPPDGGWGWVVVWASFMVHVITDGLTYSFGIFYVEFLEYFNEGKGYTSWILSLLVGVTLCSGPISSSFVNRYGCRVVTITGALLASTCLLASVFATNIATLILTIGVGTGFGLGLIYLPAIVSVTIWFEKYRSLATGIAVCGSGFGTFIFAPLTELLVTTFTWRGAMLIIAGIVLNCIIFGAMFRPVPPISKRKTPIVVIEMDTYDKIEDSQNNIIKMDDETMSRAHSHHLIENGHTNGNGHQNGHKNGKKRVYSESNHYDVDENNDNRLTVSQPFLNDRNSDHTTLMKGSQKNLTMSRPDILYQGSLYNIPHYSRSNGDLNGETSKRGSVIDNKQHSSKQVCGCIPSNMMDFSLFKSSIFLVFSLSNFCTSLGFNIPYVYLAAQAETLGLTKQDASYLLSIIGIANTVGRIILGYAADKPWVNRLLVYNMSLTICGVATALSVFCNDFYSLAFYSAVFGFTIGVYVGLTSVILVDLLGLEKLTNAFGLLLLFQGIASLAGPPMAGSLYDLTISYSPGFILAGVTIAVSGVILFIIPILQKRDARNIEQETVHAL